MTKLRREMIEAMLLRGFSVRTQRSYLDAIIRLAAYFDRSPDQLSGAELQGYFLYLAKDRGLSGSTCRLYLNAIRFFYTQVLKRESLGVKLVIPKRAQRIPELLTRREVGRILASCANLKHRMLLMTCYGCGLRVSEVVALKVRDIDGERHLLRVEQGKGAKDRNVIVGPALLEALRNYWRAVGPRHWLFPSQRYVTPLSIQIAQRAFTAAKRRAGIDKIGGIHALRHAYATHQLEAGIPVHQLQRLLGHQDIRTTLRYVHWVPDYREGKNSVDLISGMEVRHG